MTSQESLEASQTNLMQNNAKSTDMSLTNLKRRRNKKPIQIQDIQDQSYEHETIPNKKSKNHSLEIVKEIFSGDSIGLQSAKGKKLDIINLESEQSEHQPNNTTNLIMSNREQIKNSAKIRESQKVPCSILNSSQQMSDQGKDDMNFHEDFDEEDMDNKPKQFRHFQTTFKTLNTFLPKYQTFALKRDQQWMNFNKFWPVFHLYSAKSNQYIFSAKMTGNNKNTTFVVSKNQNLFIQNGQDYVGKVKSNFMGNQVCIYGPGYNPKQSQQQNLPLRRMIATVQYQTKFFQTAKPRNFKAYILKEGIDYYSLQGTKQYEQQKPLNELYKRQQNKEFIIVLENKKPTYNVQIKSYMLDFGGRVKRASMRNFILEDYDHTHSNFQDQKQNGYVPPILRMLFGKLDNDIFIMDVGNLDTYVAFGIVLSSFGNKIACE